MVYFADVTPKYDRERIFRRLHIEPGTNAYRYAHSVFPSLEEIAQQQLCMTHCYSVEEDAPPMGVPEVDRCKYRIVCLSTCSEGITRAIAKLLDQGDFLEGYILNDLVNEMLFNASDQMNRQSPPLWRKKTAISPAASPPANRSWDWNISPSSSPPSAISPPCPTYD